MTHPTGQPGEIYVVQEKNPQKERRMSYLCQFMKMKHRSTY